MITIKSIFPPLKLGSIAGVTFRMQWDLFVTRYSSLKGTSSFCFCTLQDPP